MHLLTLSSGLFGSFGSLTGSGGWAHDFGVCYFGHFGLIILYRNSGLSRAVGLWTVMVQVSFVCICVRSRLYKVPGRESPMDSGMQMGTPGQQVDGWVKLGLLCFDGKGI